jgi:uncharacterized protein (DUF342 family)
MGKRLIEVEVTTSGMHAYVIIHPATNDEADTDAEPVMPTAEAIKTELKSAGVTFGFDEEAIKSIEVEKKVDEKVLVASGTPSKKGDDGSVEYFFDTESKPRPKVQEDGRVDYHDIGLVSFVEKNALLAKRSLAKPGRSGRSINGETIPADAGEEVFIAAGPNTHFADDKNTELRATETGSVKIVNNAVTVEKNLHLKKGVNFATGNVNFPGDIVIAGDVQGGFSVKSTGKIEIHGVIEDAEIKADGDVLIKAGFTGSGKGKISSKGDVFIKFIDNQTIEAEGSVQIADSCVQANVTAGKGIEVSTGAGVIVGGHVKAKGEIIAKVLGNQKNTKTVVEVSASGGEFQAELKAKEEAIQNQKEKMIEVGTIMRKIQQARAEKADDDPILLGKVRVCQDKLHALEDELDKMEEDLKKFSKKGDCSGQIQVLKDAYPGVEFIMGGISRKVLEPIGKATFVREGEEIIDALAKAKQQDDRS